MALKSFGVWQVTFGAAGTLPVLAGEAAATAVNPFDAVIGGVAAQADDNGDNFAPVGATLPTEKHKGIVGKNIRISHAIQSWSGAALSCAMLLVAIANKTVTDGNLKGFTMDVSCKSTAAGNLGVILTVEILHTRSFGA